METPTPKARRLNRNAAIAAALMAAAIILVIGSLLTSTPEIGGSEARPLPSQQEPQAPTFLERAPVSPPVGDAVDLAALLGGDTPEQDPGMAYDAPPFSLPVGDPYAVQYASAAAPDPRLEARDRALSAGILGGSAPRATLPDLADPAGLSGLADQAASLGLAGVGSVAMSARARLLAAEVQAPGMGYEIAAGTVIHAVLVTAVDSDAPGDAVAQVTHDVYDRTMQRVLIPRASRLLGRPAGSASLGQRRLSLVWDRLVLPDGRTVLLPEVPSQDASGAGAHRAEVDNHTGAVMRNALLLSMVGAGVQLSQPQESATFGQAPSVGQTTAGAAGAQLAQVSGEMIRRGMDVRPTLSLPQGTSIQLLLTGDLALEPYP